jgi:hypothetical protein
MGRVQVFCIVATAGLFLLIFELVRRRRLMERYALPWLFTAVVLLGLSIWRSMLEQLAAALGIFYPPSALFAVAFAMVTIVLLHFAVVISRLVDQSKILAQEVGTLTARIDELERHAIVMASGPAQAPERGDACDRIDVPQGSDVPGRQR